MSIATSLKKKFLEGFEKRAAVRVFEHIKSVDPAALRAAGISRDLLAQGPSAYPWREDQNEVKAKLIEVAAARKAKKIEIRAAIAELRSFSDTQLHDLGITRGDIADVVKFGRPGIDDQAANGDRRAAA